MQTQKSLIEQQIDQALDTFPLLMTAVMAESAITDILRSAAASQDRADRWRQYSDLKRAGSAYVGWGAKNPALASPAMYQAFLDALDTLLPPSLSEDDEPSRHLLD
jgi:hypothetical protein